MSIDIEVFNAVGNRLTDIGTYKRVNPYIWAGYYGLPKSFSKLSSILFGFILKTKLYGDKAKEKDIDEDRRIYTDITLTINDVLNEWDYGKYSSGHDISKDVSNMHKRICELDANNVFYYWRYKSIYMFVMERDCRTWKFYNSQGCLIPKTMKKIVALGDDMISCMLKSVRKLYNKVDRSDVESSFGNFINRLIDRMNSLVATEVIKWDDQQDISEYLVQLSEGIKDMEDYKGLIFAEDLFDRLPLSISKKMQDDIKKGTDMKKEQNKTEESLEKEIIPCNSNLVRHKHVKKSLPVVLPVSSEKADAYNYSGNVDPFKNAVHFMKYYRAFLEQCSNGKISFDNYAADSTYATQILDLLQEHSRANKTFLMSWLRYFYNYKLKGQKVMKAKYTSLRIFKESFEEYNARHMEV